MADLARLALVLTADPTSFEAGLSRASNSAQSMVANVTNYFTSLTANLQAISANPLGGLLLGLAELNRLKNAAVAAISDITNEIVSLQREGERWSNQQGSLSRRMGVTTEVAGGLQLQARMLGMDVGTLRTSFQAFAIQLGRAAHSSTEATTALAELGIRASDLVQLSPDAALRRVGDALSHVADRGHRAQLTMHILGRRAMELEPLLSGGSAWGLNAQVQAQRWGLVLSEAETRVIKSATIARSTAEAALFSVRQGIANAVAAASAPAIQFINDLKIGFIDLLQGPLAMVRDGIRAIGRWMGAVIDGIKIGWRQLAPVWTEFQTDIADALKLVKQMLGATDGTNDSTRGFVATIVGSLGPALKTLGTVISYVIISFGAMLAGLRDAINSGLGMIQRAAQIAGDTIANILEMANQLPGSDWLGIQDQIDEVRRLQNLLDNAFAARIAPLNLGGAAGGLGNEALDNLADFNRLLHEQESLLKKLETPWERMQDQLRMIEELFSKGFLSAEQYDQALGQLAEETDRAQSRQGVQLSAGLAAGSAQAISLINQANVNATQNNDPVERLRQIQLESLQIQRRQEELGRQTRDALLGNQLQVAGIGGGD